MLGLLQVSVCLSVFANTCIHYWPCRAQRNKGSHLNMKTVTAWPFQQRKMKRKASFPRLTHLLWSARRPCDISAGLENGWSVLMHLRLELYFCFTIIDVIFLNSSVLKKKLVLAFFYFLVDSMTVLHLLVWCLMVINYSRVKVCHSTWICINDLPFSVITFFLFCFVLDIYCCLKWFKDNSQCWSQFTSFCLLHVSNDGDSKKLLEKSV